MRKKIFLLFALLCAVAQGAWAADRNYEYPTKTKPNFYAEYGGKSKVVVINTPAELAYITAHFSEGSDYNDNKDWYELDYYLNADIDMGTEYSWLPLGRESFWVKDYEGTFWGNGHTIKYKTWDLDEENQGLFSTIHLWGKVYDVNVICSIDTDKKIVGGIAGENWGLIQNCTATVDIRCHDHNIVGGIIGYLHSSATVKDCHVMGRIECTGASGGVGGIAGRTSDDGESTIRNCWVEADIITENAPSLHNADVGGIAGESFSEIQYCCMTGNVTNTGEGNDVAGITGANNKTISHCTFYGTVSVNHDQKNKYIGGDAPVATDDHLFDTFNQGEYDAAVAAGMDLYARAIKYTHAINVNIVGLSAVEVSAGGETGIPGWHPGETITLTRKSSIPVKSVTVTDADGNNVSVSGNETSGYTFTMPNKSVSVAFVFDFANWPTEGEGTEYDPYLLSSAEQWHYFAHNVLLGRSYSGKVIKLDNDISVTQSVGGYQADDNYQPFSGIFDGGGHTLTVHLSNQSRFGAPFKCVSGATIKNLHPAGTISGVGNADGKLLAGLVGVSFGNTLIKGCRSSVTLTTDFGTDAAMAGFVAGTKGGKLTVVGCVFDGEMTGSSNTRCAGIAGYEYGGTTTAIEDCLFAPKTLTVSTDDDGYAKTLIRDDTDFSIYNCYYTQVLGAAQGRECSTPTNDPGNIGSLEYDYGMVTAYDNAIFFDGKYCVAPSATSVIQPENEWDAVCWQTQTTQADWTLLDAASTTGKTLGAAGTTTYYRIAQNLNFSNTNAGGSGLTVQGTVYLYIPSGLTLTSTGANASGLTGAGAGVELAAGNTLYLVGSGTLNATGGNAANGGNGNSGTDATGYDGDWTQTGTGGNGGNGGGGAGAGIGTRGGNGGNGGSGGSGYRYDDGAQDDAENGTNGSAGTAGATAGAMGTLYVNKVYQQAAAVTVNATGGAAGSSGSGGGRGRGYAYDGYSYNVTVAGGGGGGAGGFGGAASNIGTGGPGGGGGGGGAGGAQDWRPNSKGGVYDVTAYGGKGGKNADGTSAADGAEAPTTGTAQSQGWVTVENGSFSSSDWNPASGDASFGNGGSGGGCGNASNVGTAQRVWGSLVMGSGTEADPYQIKCAADFDQLAANVNSGATYENKHFVLVNNGISVTTMVGTDDTNSFQGTFDGDAHTLTFNKGTAETPFAEEYCAPFRHVKNATIKNLHVAGTIYTSAKKAAGIVGESHGGLTITGCLCSVNINSSVSGDGSHGGLVSTLSGSGNTILIDKCVFDGSFATTAGTIGCGGFIAWPVYNTPTISNSLMKPSSVDAGMLGSTFCRVYNEPAITGCLFVATENLPTDQGTKAYVFDSAPAQYSEYSWDLGVLVQAEPNCIFYDGTYYVVSATVTLADNSDNSTLLAGSAGQLANVTLAGRTLYRDGDWNTLCLPFDLVLAGSALDGATARPLTSASISGTTLNLTFGDAVDELVAGTPYIIKWDAAAEDIVNPVFECVIISTAKHDYDTNDYYDVTTADRVRFLGTYASQSFGKEDKSILFMGAENTLYYPLDGASIGAQRAYFKIGEDGATARQLTAFSIDFFDEQSGEAERGDDDSTQGVTTPLSSREGYGGASSAREGGAGGEAWYTLDGRRLQGKPSRAGVYIYEGLKRVVK